MSTPSAATSHNVAALLPKLYEDDPDLRYMGLADLTALLNSGGPNLLAHDYHVSAKTVDGILATLKDSNGEVQNMAIKCLGPFVNKVASDQVLCPMIDKISTLPVGESVDSSIPALALRAIVINLPRPAAGVPRSKAVNEAYSAISRALIPRLVGYNVIPPVQKNLPKPPKGMLQGDMESGNDSNAIDVLTEVARCYGSMLQESEVNALIKISLDILEQERTSGVLKKKAVTAISALAPFLSDNALTQFNGRLIELLTRDGLTKNKRKLYITLIGSAVKSVPTKFGRYLPKIAPFVLSALSQEEIEEDLAILEETEERDPESDDVREAALIALESFLSACPDDMRAFTGECIEVMTRFLKYDPNLAEGEDDDDMEEEDDVYDPDEDFEEEAGGDDEDDTSWKVRRCAAKVATVLILTRSNGDLLEDGTLYRKVAPALVARFKEREETVRLEVLGALALLIRITGGNAFKSSGSDLDITALGSMGPPPTRKRKASDASMLGTKNVSLSATAPATGSAVSSLETLSPEIVRGVSSLLKGQPLPTKQASISLMKDLAVSLHGRLTDYLSQTISPVVDAVRSTGSASAGSHGATTNTFRIEALLFLGAVADAHSSQALQPYLLQIVPALVTAVKEKYTKVAVQALFAVQAYIKALTPPRSTVPGASDQTYVKQIFGAISDRISANDADTEVRRLAIGALGLLIGSTSETALLSGPDKAAGFALLATRLKNELTRLSSVRAIETVAALTRNPSEFPAGWVSTVCLELGAQLRKSSRHLRGSSLEAMRMLARNPASQLSIDSKTVAQILPLLLPLMQEGDLHLLGPALIILATFVKKDPKAVVTADFISAYGQMLMATISGINLDALLSLTRAVGASGTGKPLMQHLLIEISLKANPDLVGKVIGNLLVSGGPSIGVKLQDFVGELNAKRDDVKKCLALSVLGEAALQMGTSSELTPQLFMAHFDEKSDKVRIAAAVALGRAGAGNIPVYLPAILGAMGQPDGNQYLLLHSIREVVQHDSTESQIIPYAETLWNNLLSASQADDNRAIGAECIGRLAVIDPKTYLPQLQTFINDRNVGVRGMVISALRFTFADTDESYDEYLKPVIIGMLQTMLNEEDLENRRSALTTLNSAAQNKPRLILPHLYQLLPLAMKETIIKPELIREVQMGPFKHKVDDGLETRKVSVGLKCLVGSIY
jgi:cullin-associated NEDD8-dissociated protein 1